MPSLNIDGHNVTVDEGFTKLSPEEQNATVDEIAAQIHADKKPSGALAGFAHGAASAASGISSTLGLAGVKSDTLDGMAAKAEPKDYKTAHLIENGRVNLSALPQKLAEMSPGLAADVTAGWTGSKVGGMFGPLGRAAGGLGGFAGSMLMRNFGPGAHENADARTGVPNSPVTGPDMVREGVKQAVELPINMVAGSRILPGGSKLVGSALSKYLTSAGLGGAQAAGNDVVDQVGTTLGTKDGVKYDPTRTLEAGATGLAGGATLFAPRLAADVNAQRKYGGFETDAPTKAAAEALANRHLDIADGRKIDAKVGAEVVGSAHRDVHAELAAATKGEDLSQANANTLKRINDGDKASPGEVAALAEEVSPETMHLARQALLSSKVKKLGDYSDDSFTGGISSKMEKTLRPIYNPTGTAAAVGASVLGHAGGLGMLGTFAPQALGAIYGSYGAARILDKLTGARSPAQGFTDRFGGNDTPTRFEPPMQEQEDVGPTPQALKKEALSNIQVHEGMAKIAKQLADQKKKGMIADATPLLKQLAISIKPVEEAKPELPNISPIALKMTQARLKAGLPPEPAPTPEPAPEPAPAPVISPIAQKMLNARLKAGLPPAPEPAPEPAPAPPPAPVISPIAMKMMQTRLKAGLPPAPAPAPEPAPEPPPAPVISPIAQKMMQQKLKQGLPPEPEPAPPPGPQFNPTALAMVQKKMKQGLPDAPASPQIAAAMQSVASHNAPTAAPAAPTAPVTPPAAPVKSMADILSKLNGAQAPATPQAPLIAKISKKLNGNGKIEETPHPEADQPYEPVENLWRKGLEDSDVAQKALSEYEPAEQKKYSKTIIENRSGHRHDLEAIAREHGGDGAAIEALYHDLDHVSSREKARKSIKHFTNFMSAAAAHAVHARYTDKLISKRWKN